MYHPRAHGARKGLADTALKTADSGYLTRRLVNVAQDVIIFEGDCGTLDGIEARAIIESGEIIEPLRDRIVGRGTLETILDPFSSETILDIGDKIDEDKASAVQEAGIEKVKIRSVLTCASRRGVCTACYGRDLATGRLVELGRAVGVIAAQVDRRARHAADDAHVPHRRHRLARVREDVVRLLWSPDGTLDLPSAPIAGRCREALQQLRRMPTWNRLQAILPFAAADDGAAFDTSGASSAATGWRILTLDDSSSARQYVSY